ncbi:MAG: hypothetical protein HY807_06030 [Nitrospirae bacterium]|nr:hypothetical protein [Nitrospirota bacterium]
MKCKLTGKEGKGVSAHIIPKSFYAIDPDEKLPTKLLTSTEGHYPKRCPIGIYDNTIVTEEGERIFSEWDDYAAEILLDKKSDFEPMSHNGKIFAFQISEYDYTKLKLFVLSVLWRASVSSQPFFRRVNLGPYEKLLRETLLSGNPQDTNWFAVSIAKWSDHVIGHRMMDPFRTKFDGINYYVIYLEQYIVYCKVDQRVADKTFQAIQLKPNEPLIIVGRELSTSKEQAIIYNIVRKHTKQSL